MKTSHIIFLFAAFAVFAFHTMGESTETPAAFHDILTLDPNNYSKLINPYSPGVAKYAARLGSMEEAYKFVAETIEFVSFLPASSPDDTIALGKGSCLGKAALLVSLYRAMGIPADDIRIIRGVVLGDRGPTDHVWVDMEYKGECFQQDPSGMIGKFAFDAFPGVAYSDRFVMIENFCFNEKGFAIISQLNRMGKNFPGSSNAKSPIP